MTGRSRQEWAFKPPRSIPQKQPLIAALDAYVYGSQDWDDKLDCCVAVYPVLEAQKELPR